MTAAAINLTNTAGREIVLTREISASRALVFEAWTDPKHTVNWWGPEGFRITTHVHELKIGGVWRFNMVGPDGTEYSNRIEYQEVVAGERLAYLHGSDENPVQFHVTVTFETVGEKTRVTQRTVFPTVDACAAVKAWGAEALGYQSLGCLQAYVTEGLAKPEMLELVRTFNAPRELVFKAWTDEAHLAQWWGPKGFKMEVAKLDLQPGGMFHYGMSGPDGKLMYGKLVFREIKSPERLVFVVSFSDENRGTQRHVLAATWPLEVINIVTFAEKEGKTVLTMRGGPINANAVERQMYQGAFKAMQGGTQASLDQLEALLAKM